MGLLGWGCWGGRGLAGDRRRAEGSDGGAIVSVATLLLSSSSLGGGSLVQPSHWATGGTTAISVSVAIFGQGEILIVSCELNGF